MTTSRPGLDELVRDEDVGRIVEPGDVAGLAVALQDLMTRDDEGRTMGRRGRTVIEREFDLRRNAEVLRRRWSGADAETDELTMASPAMAGSR